MPITAEHGDRMRIVLRWASVTLAAMGIAAILVFFMFSPYENNREMVYHGLPPAFD